MMPVAMAPTAFFCGVADFVVSLVLPGDLRSRWVGVSTPHDGGGDDAGPAGPGQKGRHSTVGEPVLRGAHVRVDSPFGDSRQRAVPGRRWSCC